ncbi:hypothetical protein Tco_0805251, partial [Tanacetum coccineum]
PKKCVDWAKQGVWAYMIINSLDEAKAVIALSGLWCPPGQAPQIFGVALEGADSV